MDPTATIEEAWRRLAAPWQVCLEQAVQSFSARGLPVGAVVTHQSQIVGVGRNRVFDPPGGPDVLQRTPLAHAEMNAIAAVDPAVDLDECELWSTHAPCSMCAAAADFIEIAAVHHLAHDPSDAERRDGPDAQCGDENVWVVALNVLFLHNVAAVGTRDNPMLARNADVEPETTRLALDLVDSRAFIERLPVAEPVELLAPVWMDLMSAADARRKRLGG